jgi:iron complex transport system ATP-binding protein
VISFAGLTVRYGDTTALGGVSERIPAGQWVGVIGPNGAGKTTLLNAIAALVPYSGSVTVCGRPAGRLSRRELARLIAYVPQRPVLPPDMTVRDYVLLGRTAHIGYLRAETDADRRVCAAAIDRLDLGAMADRVLRAMSGGELQRVVIARALAQEAPVLLLDEPTSALDLGRRMDALELIDEVRRERSLTVLPAIHDLTLAGQFASRLLLLADGQIAASGSAREVLRETALAGHFGAGVQVLTTDTGDIAVISRRTRRARSGDERHGADRDDDRDADHDEPGAERYALNTEA